MKHVVGIGLVAMALGGCDGGRDELKSPAMDARVCAAQWQMMQVDFPSDAVKTYLYLPFVVEEGTRRVEVRYGWTERSPLPATPLTGTTVDLGLWDARGLQDGFRGWGGSRQGRIDRNTGPVFIEADAADRGFHPGPIQPGVWHVELGLAATSLAGADVQVEFRCDPATQAEPRPAGPLLNATAVRNPAPGWFAADFHMHGYHSQPNAPDWE
ncbi:MAG: hypothetical protein ABF296_01545, partial [Oceanococcaceae bacterium]